VRVAQTLGRAAAEFRITDARYRDNAILKKGLALTPVKFGISFTLIHMNQAGALVHLYTDGSVHLNHGGTEMGQGLYTKVVQVVAEAFQVDINKVKITATSTGKVPNTSATAASSGSDINGMAAQAAARTIKSRLTAFAAEHWEVPEEQVVFLPGRVRDGLRQHVLIDLSRAIRNGPLSTTPRGGSQSLRELTRRVTPGCGPGGRNLVFAPAVPTTGDVFAVSSLVCSGDWPSF